MAEDRTEEASAERVKRAGAQLGWPISADLSSAAVLLGLVAISGWFAAALWAVEQALVREVLAAVRSGKSSLEAIHPIHSAALARLELGLFGAIAGSALAAALLQRGRSVRVFGASGAGHGLRLPPRARFDAEALARAGSAILKTVVLTAVLATVVIETAPGVLGSWRLPAAELLGAIARLVDALLWRAIGVFAIAGVLDLALQRWLFRRRLRLSRAEQQLEQRASQGDPLLAAERRRRAHELRAQAVLDELAEVALVLLDGEGRLVALRHRPEGPVIWIKAESDLAGRLRQRAEREGRPLGFEPALVASLQAHELNEPLPAALRIRLQPLMAAAGAARAGVAPR